MLLWIYFNLLTRLVFTGMHFWCVLHQIHPNSNEQGKLLFWTPTFHSLYLLTGTVGVFLSCFHVPWGC